MRKEELMRLRENNAFAIEAAAIKKGAPPCKGVAKARLWNSGRELESCAGALRGTRKSTVVPLSSGIYSILAYRDESIAVIIDKEYAKVLK